MTVPSDRIQSAAVVIAALSMGFFFGVQWTGLIATPAGLETPAWIATAKTASMIAVGGFAAALLIVALVERADAGSGQ